jgi:hypothetical protein
VVFEVIGQDATPGMGVNPDELELLADAIGDLRDLFVGNPELGVATGGDLLVVAGADAGVDPNGDPAIVAALLQAVEGICRTDSDRESRSLFGEVDGIVKVVIRGD